MAKAIMPTVAIVTAYFRFECLFLGWLASERFLLHLPDFVLSRSFDHLPSFTVGIGIVLNQVLLLQCALNLARCCIEIRYCSFQLRLSMLQFFTVAIFIFFFCFALFTEVKILFQRGLFVYVYGILCAVRAPMPVVMVASPNIFHHFYSPFHSPPRQLSRGE